MQKPNPNKYHISFQLAALFILLGSLSRLVPHPANFTALTTLGLFSGSYLKNTSQSIIILLSALFFTDLLIGFHALMPIVYGALLLPLFVGIKMRHSNHKVLFLICGGFASALFFFITTNFSVWFFGTLYPKTVEGLLMCYTAAMPFFKNQLCGDLFYTSVLFGAFQFIKMKQTSQHIILPI